MMISARQIERWVEAGASASLGGAVAFALFEIMLPIAGRSLAGAGAIAGAGVAYRLSRWFLDFACPPPVAAPPPTAKVDLIDREARDARVVRLFDPAAQSTAKGSSSATPPDASLALREALEQLRRSLRQA